MDIRYSGFKFFFVFSMALIFMMGSCSKPAEDKKSASKQTSETSQAEPAKVETPAPGDTKSEPPAPEAQKPEESEPPAPKPKVSEQPVPPKPTKESSAIDVITMKNPAYAKHKKGIVLFTHKKHIEEYKAGCGECHHDDKGKPLNHLKTGDNVQNCIECHKIPSERPKGKDAPKLTKKQRLDYHAEAIHYNCKDCHKKFNKKNKTKKAPTTCKKCHPKKS